MEARYIVDTNIFIAAHRSIYPFDIAPSFWSQLINKGSSNILIIKEVQEEILRGKDELSDWYKSKSSNFFVSMLPSSDVIDAYRRIINSININKQYKESAKYEFAMLADSWICAYGLALKLPIVTLEKYQTDIKKAVKIPNVCKEFGIKYIDLIQFMREIDIRL